MGRRPCCDKVGLKKGRWTDDEDDRLKNYILANGEGSWRSLPKNAGLLRCGKSCRLRWINYLRSDLKRGNITNDEENTIIKLHTSLGNRWSLIASHLPGRTDNEIKNYWNSHLSRQIHTFRRRNGGEDDGSVVVDVARLSLPPRRKGGRGQRSKGAVAAAAEVVVETEAEEAVEAVTPSPATPEVERESSVGGVGEEGIMKESPEGRHDVGGSETLSFNNDVVDEDDMSLDLDGLLTNMEMEWNEDDDEEMKRHASGTCESNTAVAGAAAEVEIGGECCSSVSTANSFCLDSPWDWESLAVGHEWDAPEFDVGEDLAAESDAVISWLFS